MNHFWSIVYKGNKLTQSFLPKTFQQICYSKLKMEAMPLNNRLQNYIITNGKVKRYMGDGKGTQLYGCSEVVYLLSMTVKYTI